MQTCIYYILYIYSCDVPEYKYYYLFLISYWIYSDVLPGAIYRCDYGKNIPYRCQGENT